MATGSGVGTPVQPGVVTTYNPTLGSTSVPLHVYAQAVGADECGFWGVRRDGQEDAACGVIWRKYQRDRISSALREAQETMQRVLNYPMVPTYVDEWADYSNPLILKYARLINFGVRTEIQLEAASAVDHSTDPAVVGPILAPDTTISEIQVTHPSTGDVIYPERIEKSGDFITIYIPRCRMVKPALQDNPEFGLEYTDLTNFIETVNVSRVWLDTTAPAEVYCRTQCSCGDEQHPACVYIKNRPVSIVEIAPYRYEALTDTWIRSTWCCNPGYVYLHYLAGVETLPETLKTAQIRLAHTRLPEEPCGCEVVNQLWRRDMNQADFISLNQAQCPFGSTNGAWYAYQQSMLFRALRLQATNGYPSK